jgi:hypothetical protein
LWIGPGNEYWHDCGELHFGDGEQPVFFLPRATMDSHR